MEKKTKLQFQIELVVTGGKGYERVPYTKLLGNKRGLKQWLMFTDGDIRYYSEKYISNEKKIPLIQAYNDYFKRNFPGVIMAFVDMQDRLDNERKGLEASLSTG